MDGREERTSGPSMGGVTGGAMQAILAQVDLFSELSAEELDVLAASARRRRYGKGEVVFLRGDPGTALYVIETGRVKITLTSPEGREFLLNLLGPGDFFGDLALLDGQPRSADAVAHEACQLVLLQRDDFLHFVETHPRAAATLIAVLSQRLRHNADQLEDVNFLDVPARLARAILQLADTQGQPAADEALLIPTRLTQSELASLVGATRESVNRWLGFYERQGLLRYDGNRITVLRPEGLRKRIY